jgi:hypothetical protein
VLMNVSVAIQHYLSSSNYLVIMAPTNMTPPCSLPYLLIPKMLPIASLEVSLWLGAISATFLRYGA